MKKEISISLNPTYFCNFRCKFCYLTESQLSDRAKLKIERLRELLSEITENYEIEHIDLYGGEIGILSEKYLEDLLNTIADYYAGGINLVSNLSVIPKIFYHPMIQLSVSWDSYLRQDHLKVLENIRNISKDVHILMLVTNEMIEWSDEELLNTIKTLSSIPNIVSVELKPYSTNQANEHKWQNSFFVHFVERWLSLKEHFDFVFTNEKNIIACLKKEKRSWSDDHIYITPSGKIAVLDFDNCDREHFVELSDMMAYQDWCNVEKNKIKSNPICNSCDYLGHCLSEHLKNHQNPNDVCDGFKPLLDRYRILTNR